MLQPPKLGPDLLQHGTRNRTETRGPASGGDLGSSLKSRFGLEGIRERARLLGGNAVIETKPGQGTQVVVELPVLLRRPEEKQS